MALARMSGRTIPRTRKKKQEAFGIPGECPVWIGMTAHVAPEDLLIYHSLASPVENAHRARGGGVGRPFDRQYGSPTMAPESVVVAGAVLADIEEVLSIAGKVPWRRKDIPDSVLG